MPGLIVAYGGAWVGLPDIVPGKIMALCPAVFVKEAWTENPALICAAVNERLLVYLVGSVYFHRPVTVQNAGLNIGGGTSVDNAVSDYCAVVFVPVIIVGIAVHRKHRLYPVRHIAELFRISHAVCILSKSGPEAGYIADVNVRKGVGNVRAVFFVLAVFRIIKPVGGHSALGQLNGNVGAFVAGFSGYHCV